LLRNDFSLPDTFRLEDLVRNVVLFSILIEVIGAVALFPVFLPLGVGKSVWFSAFHSVSAFCTAGFGLLNDSFLSLNPTCALFLHRID